MNLTKRKFFFASFMFLVLAFILFAAFLIPRYGVTPFDEGIVLLDLRFCYTNFDVFQLFSHLGEDGREAYQFFIIYIDMFYPVIYGLGLVILLNILIKFLGTDTRRVLWLSYLPFGIVFFDYIENFNTLYLLNSFPLISDNAILLGSIATAAKWIFVFLSLLILIIIIFTLLAKYFRHVIKTKR